jgi:tRNA 2-selenouridine synthase
VSVAVQVPRISPADAIDGSYALVDVRSPREYAEGHAPGALSLPLLDDEQRAAVGLAYKKRGAQQARLMAMDLVSADLPGYLRSLGLLSREGTRPAVMCWRGGERSRNVVLLLAAAGVHAVQVEGGYKAYRRWVLDGLASFEPDRPVVTLYGHTGAGKTAALRALARLAGGMPPPRPWVVDLEGIALHRGSLLGGLNQPGERTQKDFDALLWEALRHPAGDYLVLEGEGGKIGRLFLPERVVALVRGGTPVLVTASVEDRARRIVTEYAPGRWRSPDVARFRRGLDLIGERLPPEESAALRRAFDDGRFDAVVTRLLVAYYDPLYQRSSVEGRRFVYTLHSGAEPTDDARRLAAALAEHLRGRFPPCSI